VCDVTNELEVQKVLSEIAHGSYCFVNTAATSQRENGQREIQNQQLPIDLIVSCLASPSGIEKDVYAVDYQATLSLLNAGRHPSVAARHFVLLSAFCCRNPILKVSGIY
jgi:divinyl chlorophyllide a 8-vinyl-reductase